MLIDFHTHTTASDGALSPDALLARAAEASISCFAITDHDTIRGYDSVCQRSPEGIRLIPGVELSCVWSGVTIHVVGLGFDPKGDSMLTILEALDQSRLDRASKIADRLTARKILGSLQGATAIAGTSQIGRPHFAQWLVEAGHVSDVNEAFDRYLGQGKLGDVKAFWPTLSEAVSAIVGSDGVAILAHPLKYKLTRMKLNALCDAFSTAGGGAIEIFNGKQTSDDTARLKRLADAFSLRVSVGSDFHRDWQYGASLGVDGSIAGNLPNVWDDFL